MPQLTAEWVAEVCEGRIVGDRSRTARAVVADSRTTGRGVAFAAVAGGHAFVEDALAAGAPFVIVERASSVPAGVRSAVVVADTVRALGALATAVRKMLHVKVIGITGSIGKTLTKDLVAAALSVRYNVHATPKSYNAELGVPLVVLGCPEDAEVMVVEMGARHAGEIAALCDVVRPRTGVVTGIGITHLEEFGSRDAIARTKSELLASLPPDGVAIVCSDDDYLAVLAASTSARLRTVGPGALVRYRADRIDRDGRTHGRVTIDHADVPVLLPIPGRALMRNAALALAIAVEYGVDPREAADAMRTASLSSYRMEITDVGGWIVVNDAYNANPTSVASALRATKELGAGRQLWAVLGAMAELGPASRAAHERVGRLVASLGYAGLVTIGEEGDDIARGAGSIALRAVSVDEAAGIVCERVPDGAVVLVKASRVVSAEGFPDILLARLDHADRKV